MTLPLIELSGSPYAQGQQHGTALRERIAHNVAVYFDRFAREVKLERGDVLERAAAYAPRLQRISPAYFDALRGVADGAGYDLLEIVALNMRYEMLYYQFGIHALAQQATAQPDGCTAFAVQPSASANGHLLIGQNWDWIPQVQGALLRTTEADGLQTLAFTEAGIVGGKIGLNSAGLGLAINGMTTTVDDWMRDSTPFHVRCYNILRARDFSTAVAIVTDEARACSANFLIAQTPDQVVDIEAAPDSVRLLPCENECVVHTNHFVDPDQLGIVEPPNERRPWSRYRLERLRELLDAKRPIGVDDLESYLRDHHEYPNSICRHEDPELPPEEHYITVCAVIMDLHARTIRISDGPPCVNPYQTVSLS